jgi:phage portal protein BeeE
MMSASTGNSIQGHTGKFFDNMSRPSGVLQSDMTLTAEQTTQLRSRFNELSQDLATGGTPILTSGLKYQAISMSAVDAEIIKTYNMTIGDIARVFRVPLELIGASDKPTAGSTEQLMQYFVVSGLGFIIEHIENSLERLFDLPAGESIELDPSILLEATFKDRMDGLKVATTGGIYSPNEARNKIGLPSVADGDIPLVQQQMVELGVGSKMLEQKNTEENNNQDEPEAKKPETKALEEKLDAITKDMEEAHTPADQRAFKAKAVGNISEACQETQFFK